MKNQQKIEHIAEIYAEKLFPEMMQWIEDEARKRFEDQQKNNPIAKKNCRTNHQGRSTCG